MPSLGTAPQFVKPGDAVLADDWNELARKINSLSGIGDDGIVSSTGAGLFRGIRPERLRDPDVVLIRNATGGALTAEHPILGLGDVVILPSDSDGVVHESPVAFQGLTPDEDEHFGKFCVLDGPVASGKFQTAVVSGGTWVDVEIDEDGHQYADVKDGSTEKLLTTDSGSAFMLWKEPVDEGQTSRAFVRLSNGGG